ncbi:MAG: GGDEF domain-containing protein [Treponema sp.]|nr:GGDEF domain-containing protein [Treponema sp.]
MSPAIYINTVIGSCLTIILIIFDYLRKFNTDNFQRRLLIGMLSAAFVSVILDFASHVISGMPGTAVSIIMYCVISVFYVAQICCFCLCLVFIDYFAHNNPERTRKIFSAVCIFMIVYAISIIINLPFGFYFSVSDNIYLPGKLQILGLLLNCVPVAVIIADVFLASKDFRQSQGYLIVVFTVITGAGAALDSLFKTGSLIWPCFSAAILYIYFFIIRSDSKLDSLTGIGNRHSFNEFINKLSKINIKEKYSIALLDLDRFKEINDTLGHLEGDNALRDMATIIKGCIRHSDFAARYGGDEFILAAKADSDIQRIIDRITESIDTQNSKRIRPYQLYFSYGYDIYSTNSGLSIHDFLNQVDLKMYRQKEERRSKIVSVISARVDGDKNV